MSRSKPVTEEITNPSLVTGAAPTYEDSEEPTNPNIVVQLDPEPAATSTRTKLPELGPVNKLMLDKAVTEIMINDTRNVIIERNGKMIPAGFSIETIEDLNRITRNILDTHGGILSVDSPYIDLMLADGSRVNIIGPPLTTSGPCITIRKFPKRFNMDDLIRAGALDRRAAYFLNVAVVGHLNILVTGGTGSGKTTLLNSLIDLIPKGERIVTIEETPELILKQKNSVKLQTKPQTPGSQAITQRDLVANALRMRPDRVVVGECRRSEALDMLQAMNTGHEGSMTTLHANNPRDGLSRLETLVLMSGLDLPIPTIRRQIASALDVVIHVNRFRSGKRRITSITEIAGMEGDVVTLQELFKFKLTQDSAQDAEKGYFKTTGFVPKFINKLKERGVELPPDYFA